MPSADDLPAAIQALQAGRLRDHRALATALTHWLTDIHRHWTDTHPADRHHAQAVARILNQEQQL